MGWKKGIHSTGIRFGYTISPGAVPFAVDIIPICRQFGTLKNSMMPCENIVR